MKTIFLLTTLALTIYTTEFKNNGSVYKRSLNEAQNFRASMEEGKINYYERKMKKSYHPED